MQEGGDKMNIKYIGNEPSQKGKVHKDKGNGFTGCGREYKDNREDWEKTFASVNCQDRGCK